MLTSFWMGVLIGIILESAILWNMAGPEIIELIGKRFGKKKQQTPAQPQANNQVGVAS